MEKNIVIKGKMQKNQPAIIAIVIGAILLVIAFFVALHLYKQGESLNYRYGVFSWVPWIDRLADFFSFFFGEFVNPEIYYNSITIVGGATLLVGIIIKISTEKCEIIVTDEAIIGKRPHGKEVQIPLNKITAISRNSFNGISITSIGSVNNFYCFENREEVINTISCLLTKLQQDNAQLAQSGSATNRLERLKSLLDAGLLTQDEFDTKKRQILGL